LLVSAFAFYFGKENRKKTENDIRAYWEIKKIEGKMQGSGQKGQWEGDIRAFLDRVSLTEREMNDNFKNWKMKTTQKNKGGRVGDGS